MRAQILVSTIRRASEARCEAAPRLGDVVNLFGSQQKKNSARSFVHSRSSILQQFFHNRGSPSLVRRPTRRSGACAVATVALLSLASPAASQPLLPETIYRVFLKTGHALPSYGEAAAVGDRLIFNLSIGGSADRASLELLSLPVAVVDIERTARYALAMRAAYYAATRGETDYTALRASIARDLEEIRTADRPRQLHLAEELHLRLVTWSKEHFFYRAKETEELAGLAEDVIREIRDGHGGDDLIGGPGFRADRATRDVALSAGRGRIGPACARSRGRSRHCRRTHCRASSGGVGPWSRAKPLAGCRHRVDSLRKCGPARRMPRSRRSSGRELV